MNPETQISLKAIISEQLANSVNQLGEQEMEEWVAALQRQPTIDNQIHSMIRMLQCQLVYTRFYNKFDRSYFLEVFANPEFLRCHENRSYCKLALTHKFAQQIIHFPYRFGVLLEHIGSILPSTVGEQISQSIKSMMICPHIAMPRLLREASALSVKSNYQSFLSSSNDSAQEHIRDHQFEVLKSYIQAQEEKILVSMLKSSNRPQNKQFQPQFISHRENLTYCRLQQLPNRNILTELITSLLALLQLYLQQIEAHLEIVAEGDSVELILQLVTRYIHFQNSVLHLQSNFGYLFTIYEELHQEVYGKVFNTTFRLHKLAMEQWKRKIGRFHNLTNEVFSYLLLNQITQETAEQLLQERENIHIHQHLMAQLSESAEKGCHRYRHQVYEYINESQYDLDMLLSQYVEYQVDMSIDQINVNKSGHSTQLFGNLYTQLEDQVLTREQQCLKGLSQQAMGIIPLHDFMNKITMSRLNTYGGFVRPRTVQKIANLHQNYTPHHTIILEDIERQDKIIEKLVSRKAVTKNICRSNLMEHNDTADSLESTDELLEYESESEVEEFIEKV